MLRGERWFAPPPRSSQWNDTHSARLRCAMFGASTGGHMSEQAIETLITNAIHSAFIKYPAGDGGPNLDYEWIAPDQSAHITKAILQDLAANGYQVVKKGG
jgi:hypothetical protein